MKKIFYFVLIGVVSFFVQIFISGTVMADVMYGVASLSPRPSIGQRIRLVAFCGLIISIVFLFIRFISSVVGFFRSKFIKVPLDYTRFKPNDKVKITYICGDKEITQKVQIAAIDDEKISFYFKKKIKECLASKVINIKKCRKLGMFFWINILYLLLCVLYMIFCAVSVS